jgi:hypothetical protein
MPGNLCHVDCSNKGLVDRSIIDFSPLVHCVRVWAPAQVAATIPRDYADVMKVITGKPASSNQRWRRTKAGEFLCRTKLNKIPFYLTFDSYVAKSAPAPE